MQVGKTKISRHVPEQRLSFSDVALLTAERNAISEGNESESEDTYDILWRTARENLQSTHSGVRILRYAVWKKERESVGLLLKYSINNK